MSVQTSASTPRRSFAGIIAATLGATLAVSLVTSVALMDSANAAVMSRVVDLSGINGSGKTSATSNIYTLASRPGASKTLYLDVTGATITNTLWNTYYGQDSVELAPFSIDQKPALTTAEKNAVRDIWQRVAEDFAPFDINVTTVEPTPDLLDKADAADTVYGTTAVLSGTTGPIAAKCGCGAGTINSDFDAVGSHTPIIVWTALPYTNSENIANGVSHEIGHAIGLGHHGLATAGSTTSEYYDKPGDWAPLMGTSDNTLTQWSDGSYRNASNPGQDDIAFLTRKIGATADDYGNDPATALALTPTHTSGVTGVLGNISTRTDTDWFAFRAYGATTVSVSPLLETGMNLDASLKIVDEKGKTVATVNGARFTSKVAKNLPAGLYYAVVDGAGSEAVKPTYTDYGSLGRYILLVKTNATPTNPITVGAKSQVTLTRGKKVTAASGLKVTATGAKVAYGFKVTSGRLPAGLVMDNSSGVILGTPNTVGTSVVTITVTDALGAVAATTITFTVK